jgi:hypothetical protein
MPLSTWGSNASHDSSARQRQHGGVGGVLGRGECQGKYLGYHGLPVTAQNSRYDRFSPTANDWGNIHPYQETSPPLQVEEEVPPT